MDKFFKDIEDATSNPILRTYCQFKKDYRKEPYLIHASNRNYLTAISRFRTSSHSLHIETGRHTTPITPKALRICNFCQLNSIDDERHMLLECPFHNPEREILIQSLQSSIPIRTFSHDLNTFISVMQLKHPDSINALGKYLCTGFLRRKEAVKSAT